MMSTRSCEGSRSRGAEGRPVAVDAGYSVTCGYARYSQGE
eukprot:CAMPEP_0118830290 /NCGR_PEP_ID=MMETSP1162-20130426/26396_1 /TAXON_ID=33656 /ORGANISM="Phaeocystis Sp, Strain CCMP2710" /LENGTH=39 /DNA_ID= /DNA_START= /DNA_END= /DNA_ORIENTATION=